jgi:hypothetical protein
VSWADHDHRGDYAAAGHSHRDYAGVLHRHRHDEAAIERLEAALHRAQSRISRLEETIARLAGALELPAGEHEETWRSGTAGAALYSQCADSGDVAVAVSQDGSGTIPACAGTPDRMLADIPGIYSCDAAGRLYGADPLRPVPVRVPPRGPGR